MAETRTNGLAEGASAAASPRSGGSVNVRATTVQASNEWWQQLDQRIYQCIKLWVEQWYPPERDALTDAVGQVFGEHHASVRETITNLKERVIRLETTSNFEERLTKLAHEVKRGSEVPQGELLEKIEALQHQLDELKKVAAQPGPQGPPGPPGKLPRVKEYAAGRVHYEADVVVHAGALWQARGDTVHAPPHSDWICLARAGRNGCDGGSPNICGTYDAREKYERLDIVALDDAAFIARRDNPGICPGDGWQLLSRQGRPGRRGENGERGQRGEEKRVSAASLVQRLFRGSSIVNVIALVRSCPMAKWVRCSNCADYSNSITAKSAEAHDADRAVSGCSRRRALGSRGRRAAPARSILSADHRRLAAGRCPC
jgi:hypothetical protein